MVVQIWSGAHRSQWNPPHWFQEALMHTFNLHLPLLSPQGFFPSTDVNNAMQSLSLTFLCPALILPPNNTLSSGVVKSNCIYTALSGQPTVLGTKQNIWGNITARVILVLITHPTSPLPAVAVLLLQAPAQKQLTVRCTTQAWAWLQAAARGRSASWQCKTGLLFAAWAELE